MFQRAVRARRIAGTGKVSKHAHGAAIDFDAGGRKGAIVSWLIKNHHSGGTMTYRDMGHIHVDIGHRFVKLGANSHRAIARQADLQDQESGGLRTPLFSFASLEAAPRLQPANGFRHVGCGPRVREPQKPVPPVLIEIEARRGGDARFLEHPAPQMPGYRPSMY